METLTAHKAKNSFGEALQKAQRMPVKITKSGKPFAVIMSIEDYEAAEELKMRFLKESIAEAWQDMENGRVQDADQFFDNLEAEQ